MMREKRRHSRVPFRTAFSCESPDGKVFAALATDMSLGGMFLECDTAPAFGTQLTLIGRLPGAETLLRLPAVVRWSKPNGVGLQFGPLGARETHALTQLFSPCAAERDRGAYREQFLGEA